LSISDKGSMRCIGKLTCATQTACGKRPRCSGTRLSFGGWRPSLMIAAVSAASDPRCAFGLREGRGDHRQDLVTPCQRRLGGGDARRQGRDAGNDFDRTTPGQPFGDPD
jgi:hypothetical protein